MMEQTRFIYWLSRKSYPIYALAFIALLCHSCREQVETPAGRSEDAQISFICASAQMMNINGYGIPDGYVLIDNTDSAFPLVRPDLTNQPFFNSTEKFMYPNTSFNASLTVPWTFYMHLYPGRHSFTLLDTGLLFRAGDQFQLAANAPVSIYYADSLGFFRSLVMQDRFTTSNGQVNLRFLDLSPDAGNIFFTIDEQPAAAQGFDSTYRYGQAGAFVNFPNPVSDTLRISFYQAGDSVDVIAREFLQADPGHAYTFALQGYYNTSPSYIDPLTGKPENPLGGLSILVNKNY
jgi:hypothetical protein